MSVADELLDAQVAYLLDTLSDDALQRSAAEDVAAAWAIASGVRLDEILAEEDLMRIITDLMTATSGSVTVSTMLGAWTDVVLDGPPVDTTPEDLVDRDHVESLVSTLLSGSRAVAEGQGDRLASSPQVGALASRFISRIVMEGVQANKAVAERIPGMGSMFALGSSAASMVAGVADRPLQAMGDTAGKGAAIAVKRLRKVVVETLEDPVFAAAVMEVWDLGAGESISGIEDEDSRALVHRMVGILQQIVIEASSTPQAQAGVASFVRAFYELYGEHPPTTLLEELGIEQPWLIETYEAVLPRAVAALRADGSLEALIRARLEPFFHSPAVQAILDGQVAGS